MRLLTPPLHMLQVQEGDLKPRTFASCRLNEGSLLMLLFGEPLTAAHALRLFPASLCRSLPLCTSALIID